MEEVPGYGSNTTSEVEKGASGASAARVKISQLV